MEKKARRTYTQKDRNLPIMQDGNERASLFYWAEYHDRDTVSLIFLHQYQILRKPGLLSPLIALPALRFDAWTLIYHIRRQILWRHIAGESLASLNIP